MTGSPTAPPSILDLPVMAESLPPRDAARFRRIYAVVCSEGRLRVPQTMAQWVERTFGSVAAVETQRIVRVINLVTGEASLFNELRALRPTRIEAHTDDDIAEELQHDPWAQPTEATPEDLFGRLAGSAALTAANVAKYDAHHSLLIFNDPHPLRFDRESVRGHVELANRWFATVHETDPDAVYPFFLWNCLWRAGGSMVHGHAQVQLARERHYARVDALRRAADDYRTAHGADYFDDLFQTHAALGLAMQTGNARVMPSLTPVKEKEAVILAPRFDEELADVLFDTLAVFRDALGVRSFNVGAQLPPLRDDLDGWDGFPAVVRIVDRGNLGTRTSDIGSMELFAEPVVSSDPFALARALAGTE